MPETNEQSVGIQQLGITASLGTCWPKSCSAPDLMTTMDTGKMPSVYLFYAVCRHVAAKII